MFLGWGSISGEKEVENIGKTFTNHYKIKWFFFSSLQGSVERGREFEKGLKGWDSCWGAEDFAEQRKQIGLLSRIKEHTFVTVSICTVGQG